MPSTQIRPLRYLRKGVGLAFKGVRAGVGGTVRLVWPVRKRRSRPPTTKRFADNWIALVSKTTFEPELCDKDNDHCQALMTVGSRQWGGGKGMPGVKLYEFAVYADPQQVRRSSLGSVIRKHGDSLTANKRFYHQLRSTKEVDMSIIVKSSRNLPIRLMSTEYEKILRRRLTRVGGSEEDPSLSGFLGIFNSERLPAHVQDERKNVKKGSTMCFKRSRDGTLSAYADEVKVGTVKSQALCSALFDLYLGDDPVSVDARTIAANRFLHVVMGHEEALPISVKKITARSAE